MTLQHSWHWKLGNLWLRLFLLGSSWSWRSLDTMLIACYCKKEWILWCKDNGPYIFWNVLAFAFAFPFHGHPTSTSQGGSYEHLEWVPDGSYNRHKGGSSSGILLFLPPARAQFHPRSLQVTKKVIKDSVGCSNFSLHLLHCLPLPVPFSSGKDRGSAGPKTLPNQIHGSSSALAMSSSQVHSPMEKTGRDRACPKKCGFFRAQKQNRKGPLGKAKV